MERVPSCGVVRRLQGLAVAGWPLADVAARLGVTPQAVQALRLADRDRVNASTADRVRAVYDDLWWRTPPPGRSSTYAANKAARSGWAGPWQWDGVDIDDPAAVPVPDDAGGLDEVLVERLVAGGGGGTLRSHAPEFGEAVRRLAGQGLSDAEIGTRLGRSRDAVLKLRERRGIPAGVPATGRAEAAA